MRYGCFFIFFFLIAKLSFARFDNLKQGFASFAKDTSYRQANISFTLLDVKMGKLLFEQNKNVMLAPASTLKTFTTASALHYLGEDFRYETKVTFKGAIQNKRAKGILKIYGSGDPSFGSDRFGETKPEAIKKAILDAMRAKGIDAFSGQIEIVTGLFSDMPINPGWLDEDIGNYYGAGVYALNWKENKFELNLVPTKTGFEVSSTNAGYDIKKDFCLELTHKDGATTEEAFAFVEKDKPCMYVIRGVLSKETPTHNMQLARLHPDQDFKQELTSYLKREINMVEEKIEPSGTTEIELTTIYSPPLKQLVYWCNQKSLNLYAESFCKTISLLKKHNFKTPYVFPRSLADTFLQGSWLSGIYQMKAFASQLGLNANEIQLLDGSGLAPINRITTNVMANLLRQYTKQSFFSTFYESLPSINGLRMKSGYIGGTRSYAGYIKLSDSSEACFAFVVNNYSCSPKQVKLKMFQILDIVKAEK